ncbi:MAG: hypothetical protein ACYC9O_16220 [Candidatus Latescibacterota bacterium]
MKNADAAIVSEPAFAASEKETFHAKSKFESARKARLTEFGSMTVSLPEETPSLDAAAVVVNPPDMERLNFSTFDTETLVHSAFPFDYENDVAALRSLFALHRLDTVIKDSMTEMEKLAALAVYTNGFLEEGKLSGAGEKTGPSAFLITKNLREKGIGGESEIHSALFCQLALSCGFTARLVGMHTLDDTGNPLPYAVCEVYINELKKWVAFDSFSRATYYLRGALPLSALELHATLVENRLREVSPVPGIGDLTDIVSLRENTLRRYRFIYLWRMNDILGRSPRDGSIPWESLYQAHLVWEDRNSLISEGGFEKLPRFAGGVKYATHNPSDFEWTLNLVKITAERSGPESVKLYFDTICPNFSRFDLYLGGTAVKTGNTYEMKAPFDYVSVMSMNAFGIRGRSSKVQIMQ